MAKNNIKNTKKKNFLHSIQSRISLNEGLCDLGNRSKYNFSYLVDNIEYSVGLDHPEMLKIMPKLKEFSRKSLRELVEDQKLIIYRDFPSHSKFPNPKHIPHDVHWARFRLQGAHRLAGFVIPEALNGEKYHKNNKFILCSNTFYVVYIDLEHKFYPVNKK